MFCSQIDVSFSLSNLVKKKKSYLKNEVHLYVFMKRCISKLLNICLLNSCLILVSEKLFKFYPASYICRVYNISLVLE